MATEDPPRSIGRGSSAWWSWSLISQTRCPSSPSSTATRCLLALLERSSWTARLACCLRGSGPIRYFAHFARVDESGRASASRRGSARPTTSPGGHTLFNCLRSSALRSELEVGTLGVAFSAMTVAMSPYLTRFALSCRRRVQCSVYADASNWMERLEELAIGRITRSSYLPPGPSLRSLSRTPDARRIFHVERVFPRKVWCSRPTSARERRRLADTPSAVRLGRAKSLVGHSCSDSAAVELRRGRATTGPSMTDPWVRRGDRG